MKQLKTFTAVVIMLIAAACSEHEQNSSNTASKESSLFNERVGAPINKDVGLHWIENRNSRTRSSTREFYYKSTDLKEILNSRCVGISFHYAMDENGNLHLLPIGTTQEGRPAYTNKILDAIRWIPLNTAQSWIANYDGLVRSHFFGANTFKRMIDDNRYSVIRATLALDTDGNPQVLLSDGLNPNPDEYEDKSIPCPPVCPLH